MPTSFDDIRHATRLHQAQHGCEAYTFADGEGLIALVKAHQPSRILELGTALGFTACCLAQASPASTVDTIDRDHEHVSLARANIHNAGLAARVTVHEGDFAVVMKHLNNTYEAVFFDGLSPDAALIEQIRAMLRPGGLLICANLIWANDEVLMSDLMDTGRWAPFGQIEGGATRVFSPQSRSRPLGDSVS